MEKSPGTRVNPPPPPPPAPHLQYWTRVHVSTLYGDGGGGGGEATQFKTDNSAFFETPFSKHRRLMQLFKCPKEFCPPLQLFVM